MAPNVATLIGRRATFEETHKVAKRRSSSQKKKTTTSISWPHAQPAPMEMASAGFYYKPTEKSPDNVVCFHCDTQMNEWEENDNPVFEHCAIAPDCAWAKIQAIRIKAIDPLAEFEDPTGEAEIEIRLATFGIHWPHENKKGWKPKSQKLAEAGWFYDPSPEDGEDGASCAYCGLSLDGWEPKDNPLDEHRKRSSECRFFTLPTHFKASKKRASTAKRTSTTKRARTSRQSSRSRVSVSSNVPDSYVEPEMTPPRPNADISVFSTSPDGASFGGQPEQPEQLLDQPPPKKTRGRKKKATDSIIEESAEPSRGRKRTSDGAVKKQPKRATKKKQAVAEVSIAKPEEQAEVADSKVEAVVEDVAVQQREAIVLDDTIIPELESEPEFQSTQQDVTASPVVEAEAQIAQESNTIMHDESTNERASSPFQVNVEAEATQPEIVDTTEEPTAKKQKTHRTSDTRTTRHSSQRESGTVTAKPAAKGGSKGRAVVTKASTPEPNAAPLNTDIIIWEPIDIENVFLATPVVQRVKQQLFDAGNQENIPSDPSVNEVLKYVRAGLTDAEKNMSVEEWIRHNANRQAEALKNECEVMVVHFEAEGARAMKVLESLPVH